MMRLLARLTLALGLVVVWDDSFPSNGGPDADTDADNDSGAVDELSWTW